MHRVPEEKSIAITRPLGQGEKTSEFVRKLGWTPFIVHSVELRRLEGETIFKEFSQVVNRGPVDWLVFMSTTGVDAFFDMLRSYSSVLPSAFGRIRLIAVGPKTNAALRRHGVQDAIVPESYSSIGIIECLSRPNMEGQRVVLVRSSAADERLANALASKELVVETITIYQSRMPAKIESVLDFLVELEQGRFQAVLFTSAISTSNLFTIAEGRTSSPLADLLRSRLVGAVGPFTAEKLLEQDIDPIVPKKHLIEEAIGRLVREYEEKTVRGTGAFS